MSRSLLIRLSSFSNLRSTPCIYHLRHRSSSSEIISGEIPTEETMAAALKELEDVIDKIIVKRSQPDWLPFVPGASYWVPPKSRERGLVQVIGKLAYDKHSTANLMKDNKFSISSNRGWPSSAHFFKGASHSPLEGEITPKNTSQSEDEEG